MNKRRCQTLEERKKTIKEMKIQLLRMSISKNRPNDDEIEELYHDIWKLERPIFLKQHNWVG